MPACRESIAQQMASMNKLEELYRGHPHASSWGQFGGLVADGLVDGAHDVSTGGLGVCLAEMAARSGVGVTAARVADHAALFGEGPGRVVVAVDPERLTEVLAAAEAVEVSTSRIGLATGDRLVVKDLLDVSVEDLRAAHHGKLPAALGSGTTNR